VTYTSSRPEDPDGDPLPGHAAVDRAVQAAADPVVAADVRLADVVPGGGVDDRRVVGVDRDVDDARRPVVAGEHLVPGPPAVLGQEQAAVHLVAAEQRPAGRDEDAVGVRRVDRDAADPAGARQAHVRPGGPAVVAAVHTVAAVGQRPAARPGLAGTGPQDGVLVDRERPDGLGQVARPRLAEHLDGVRAARGLGAELPAVVVAHPHPAGGGGDVDAAGDVGVRGDVEHAAADVVRAVGLPQRRRELGRPGGRGGGEGTRLLQRRVVDRARLHARVGADELAGHQRLERRGQLLLLLDGLLQGLLVPEERLPGPGHRQGEDEQDHGPEDEGGHDRRAEALVHGRRVRRRAAALLPPIFLA
jgi:hypothetical protein